MGTFHRFVSNMKDAIAYFGFSAVLRGAVLRRYAKATEQTSRPSHLSGA
jgi:hypothetical protein